MEYTEIGKRIKVLREEKNVTQKEAAQQIGIQQSTLSKYERGIQNPRFQELCLISDWLGVSVDYLLGRTDIKSTPTDGKLQAAAEVTGLSGNALAVLKYWNENETQKMHLETLSKMLECGGMPMFLEYIYNASSAYHENLKISNEIAFFEKVEENVIKYNETEEIKDFNSYRAQKQLDHIIENI